MNIIDTIMLLTVLISMLITFNYTSRLLGFVWGKIDKPVVAFLIISNIIIITLIVKYILFVYHYLSGQYNV